MFAVVSVAGTERCEIVERLRACGVDVIETRHSENCWHVDVRFKKQALPRLAIAAAEGGMVVEKFGR